MVRIIYLVLLILTIYQGGLRAQAIQNKSYGSGDYLGLTVEAGITTFFGDIDEGAADNNVFKNNVAYKIQASRNFSSQFEISGRISHGKMSGQKKRGNNGTTTYFYFNNQFTEYTIDIGINLLAIITKKYDHKLGLYGSIGMGLIDFKVQLLNGGNDTLVRSYGYNGEKATTEFVLPIGIRAIYHITPNSALSLQTTSSRVDTDKLDAMTGNNNSDYYNFFSIGYTYKLLLNRRREGGIPTGIKR
jgi:hypothetical protein